METLNLTPALSLDFKPIFIPKTIGQFLGEVSRIGSVSEKVLQVDDFVTRLETETRKIEAFKRELPLCMILVNDAIIALKEESMMLKNSSHAEPVLEEFIPLKNSCDEDAKFQITINKNDSSDKKNWLSSTQLWNTNENLNHKANSVEQIINKRSEVEDDGIKNPTRGNGLLTKTSRSNISPLLPHQQTSRKQRRSWSTELHRRFVNALQQLGGSQAATPKQIRELMQVDGLTNDEVKSHLQKYRLHTRKLPSLNNSSSNQYFEFSKCSNSQSGSPDGPLLNGRIRVDDEEDENSEHYCWNGNL